MRIDLSAPGAAFKTGQQVQGEVVGHLGSGSVVVVNGVTTRTDRQLPIGQKIQGNIESASGAQATLKMEPTPVKAPDLTALAWTQWNVSPTAENQQILDLMRRFGITPTPESWQQVLRLMAQSGGETSIAGMKAALLLLLEKLPASALPQLQRYFKGELRFSSLLQKLPASVLAKLSEEWSLGAFMKKLEGLLGEGSAPGSPGGAKDIAGDLAENLRFQEILSQAPANQAEGRLYFQWPVFWPESTVPDTLEGEAYYAGKDRKGQGFTLRLLAHPPTLGGMEIALHSLEKALWVHFGVDSKNAQNSLPAIFEPLRQTLLAKGWTSVRLSIGEKPLRKLLLEPPESLPRENPLPHPVVDLKV